VKLAFIKEFTRFENLEESSVQRVTEEESPPVKDEELPPVIDESESDFSFDDEDYGFDF